MHTEAGPLAPTTQTFERDVLQANEPVLVEFWAPWCGPCQAFKPTVTAVAEDRALNVAFVNVDDEPDLAERYDVRSIPALMLFKNGRLVAESVGARSAAELTSWLADNGA